MVTFPLAHQSALALRAALPGGAVAVEKFDRGTHPPKRPELAMAADFIRRRLSSTEGLGPMPPGTEAGAAVGVETTAAVGATAAAVGVTSAAAAKGKVAVAGARAAAAAVRAAVAEGARAGPAAACLAFTHL